MKQIEQIAEATNFKAVNLGRMSDLNEYVLELGSRSKDSGKGFWRSGSRCHWRRILHGRYFSQVLRPVSCIRTRSTKNFTSSSAAKASFK